MQRYTEDTHSQMPAYMDEDPQGDWVKYDDAQAEIARLTAKLAQARAALGLAYETAADVAADLLDKRAITGECEDVSNAILDIDPDATTALAEIVKKAVDEDRKQFDGYIFHQRNCDMMSAFIQGKHCTCGLDAILARIDQRKEVGK